MKLKTALGEGDQSGEVGGTWGSGVELMLRRRPRFLSFPPRFDFHLRSFQRRVRDHMKVLIPKANWLQDLVHPGEIEAWNPETDPCCTPATFKINFRGTPRDLWNLSASRVFTDHFLLTHSNLYEDTWENRRMVLNKTQAHIKSLLRSYHRQFTSNEVDGQRKVAQRRRERKSTVSFSHRY
jgi:hypothetical protein